MTTLEQLAANYPSETFRKGQTLLLKGETPSAMHYIEKGHVKAYAITSDGAERQVAIHEKGEAIPLGYGVRLIDETQYFYEAYTDCTIRLIPRSIFTEMLQRDPELLYKSYVRVIGRYLNALDQITALEHPKAGDKVAFMLMNLAGQVGTKMRPDATRRKLAITQQEIADALGLARETTSAELKKLEKSKILTHSRKSYVLYMERLRDYLSTR